VKCALAANLAYYQALASVPKLHARFSDTARRPFFVAIHSGEQKEIERKLLVLALSRAYLVTGA